MSLQHFFLNEQVLADETDAAFPLRLEADDAKHARVLRLAPGEQVAVVDAVQDYFVCEIVSFDDVIPLVRIASHPEITDESPTVVLVQGLAKGDKMDMIVRHATELGVSAFVPLICDRSIVRFDAKKAAARVKRWRAVAKSAAMQSGQRAVPDVIEPVSIEEACKLFAQATAVLVCWEEAPSTASLADALRRALSSSGTLSQDVRIAVIVGPEGGLTQHEVNALLTCNDQASLVTLGPTILRTETAGIVAPALVLYELVRRGGPQ